MFDNLSRIVVVTGHYGVGKTNFALNLAVGLASGGEEVTIIDMDVVNPYFRTADHGELLKNHGVKVLQPNFANTLLDVPSLPREISGALESDGRILVDLGGDDAGASVLGRYKSEFAEAVDMLYLFSAYRPQTAVISEVPSHIRAVESASRQRVTRLVNSSNLSSHTTASDIEATDAAARELSRLVGIPLEATLALEGLRPSLSNVYSVRRYVRLPWETQIDE